MDTSRIVELTNKQGKTQAHLCRLLGKSRTYLRDLAMHRFELNREQLEIIAAELGTTAEYLNWETDDPRPDREEGVKIPVLGEVAAGLPIEAVENIVDWENIWGSRGRKFESSHPDHKKARSY